MKKVISLFLLIVLVASGFVGCANSSATASSQEVTSSIISSQDVSSQTDSLQQSSSQPSSSQANSSQANSLQGQSSISTSQTSNSGIYLGFKLKSKIDLSSAAALTVNFIDPLSALNMLWNYSWRSPADIKSDDLLMACGLVNYLGLERYSKIDERFINGTVSANIVESALFERFGVSAAYLKTSQFYDSQANTYSLAGAGGGGGAETAIWAKQDGDIITIQTGLDHPVDESTWPATSGDIKELYNSVITPQGILTIQLTEDGHFKYISYVVTQNVFKAK